MIVNSKALLLVSVFSILLLCYAAFSIDMRYVETKNEVERLADDLVENDSLRNLLNASTIDNIPSVKILSTNASVAAANRCSQTPLLFSRKVIDDHDCITMCANSHARAINVGEGEEYVSNDTVLPPGGYCRIGPRPNCNTRTTRPFMTVNSVVCRSKFPRVFGGETGDRVVACNNNEIYDRNNVFMDYKYGANPVTPDTVPLDFDENERLSDGSFRYACRFRGRDEMNNLYVEHPYERLQPMRNYCASELNNAHPDVRTVFAEDRTYACDCGDPNRTRVANMYKNDPSSFCVSQDKVASSRTVDGRGKSVLAIPYRCFTKNSKIGSVTTRLPCPAEQFLDGSSDIAVAKFNWSRDDNELLEHPYSRNIGRVELYDRQGEDLYIVD